MQVRYLNRALQHFDSTQVIPIQFVLFTLCVITGSAVLYRDFERTTARQAAEFVFGCLLTFFGVFLITSGRPHNGDDDEDTLSDADGVEETIGLAEHGQPAPQTPPRSSRRGSESDSSRRNSRTSRNFSIAGSLAEAMNRPLISFADSGVPTLRTSAAGTPSRSTPFYTDGNDASSPHGSGRRDSYHDQGQQRHQHPGAGSHTISEDSVFTVQSAASEPSTAPPETPRNSGYHVVDAAGAQIEQPSTPRASLSLSRPHSNRNAPMISPSPFSSTVSAVVADKLLPHDSASLRKAMHRRSRPSLMGGIFVPQDAIDDEEGGALFGATGQHPAQGDSPAREGERLIDIEPEPGFRGRARSLSNTLGELLGVRRKRDAEAGEGEAGPLLPGASTRAFGSGSTETL